MSKHVSLLKSEIGKRRKPVVKLIIVLGERNLLHRNLVCACEIEWQCMCVREKVCACVGVSVHVRERVWVCVSVSVCVCGCAETWFNVSIVVLSTRIRKKEKRSLFMGWMKKGSRHIIKVVSGEAHGCHRKSIAEMSFEMGDVILFRRLLLLFNSHAISSSFPF